ncbi:hypothetical protein OAH43_00575, partial [bacterium]|nr:hypothetical protein [bacterium]
MTNKKFTVKTQEELVANFTSTSDKSIFQINNSNLLTSNSLIFQVQENSAKIKFYDETNDIAEIISFNNDSITISSNVVIQNTLNVSNLNVYGTTTTINTSKYETENLEIINTQLDAPSLRIQQSYESTNLNNILDVGSLNSTGNYEQKMVLDTTGNLNISGNIDFNGNLTNSGNTLIYNENSLKTFLSGKKVTTLNLSQNAEIKINDEVKLFHWSHNINNSDVTNSIYYTDTNLLSDISGFEYGAGQLYKSHVNITADIGEGKYTDNLGFLIQNRQRNNAIGFGYNTISQVGNNTNGYLNIKSKGNLPVSIGNETTNTLYVFNDKVSVGISSPTRLFQVGENANTGANDQVIALSQHAGDYLWELSMTRWNKYSSGSGKYDLEIKPNSTNGTTASNLGSILLMPNINVGIGTTTPSEKLHVSGNTYIEGKVCIGHNIYPSLQPGALSIGYTDADYGGGNNWNTNTAGLLLNCKDNTEIAVHDAGLRIASFMYYEGANNRITIGRNMYWGSISTIALNGDIGIGTSSPDEKLTVYDGRIKIHQNSSTDNAVLHLLSNTYNTYLFTDKTNGTFLIRNHYNNDFIFDSNGNVGIGVSPQTKLHVQGGNNTYLRVETDTNDAAQTSGIEFGIPAFNSAVRSKITSTTHSSDASDLKFYTNPTSSTIAQARMIIDKDGNVGIGTTPSNKLHLHQSTNNVGIRLSTNSQEYYLYNSDNSNSGGAGFSIQNKTDGSKVPLRIKGTGEILFSPFDNKNVGIGTDNPDKNLHVIGDIKFTGDLYKNNSLFTSYTDSNTSNYLNNLDTHIIPITDQTIDIGSVDKKIRDIYVSNNSIWMGDYHKLMVSNEKLKFKKRNKNVIPTRLTQLITDADIASRFNGKTKSDILLHEWLEFAKEKDPTIDNINEVFEDNDINYEEQSNIDFWLSTGNHIYLHGDYQNIGIGVTNPLAKLCVHSSTQGDGVLISENNALLGKNSNNDKTQLMFWNGSQVYYGRVSSVEGSSLGVTAHNFRTGTSNITTMRIVDNKVGIGIDSPKTILNVHNLLATNDSNIRTANTGNTVFNTESLWLGKGDTNNENYWGLSFGTIWAGSSYIQALNTMSNTYYDLMLQPNGGNIGINNKEPSEKLDIDGNVIISSNLTVNNINILNTFNKTAFIINQTIHQPILEINNNNSNVFLINYQGGVGINNTNPLYELDVNGSINFTGDLKQNGELFTSFNDQDAIDLLNTGFGGGLKVTSGNVGIGTNNPLYELDVNGSINFTGDLKQNGELFTSFNDQDAIDLLNTGFDGGLKVTSGNVGIGTTNPNYKLDVNGNIKFTTN